MSDDYLKILETIKFLFTLNWIIRVRVRAFSFPSMYLYQIYITHTAYYIINLNLISLTFSFKNSSFLAQVIDFDGKWFCMESICFVCSNKIDLHVKVTEVCGLTTCSFDPKICVPQKGVSICWCSESKTTLIRNVCHT